MTPDPLPEIHADIRKAATMPSRFYADQGLFARSRERLFARSWQFAGDLGKVKIPGQVFPFTLLEGMLDEPLLLTRDRDDRLHCMSNVCTHRGTLVCEGPGVETGLRCRYHGRRFGLDGKFQFMPEFEGAAGFPSERDHLPQLPLESWGPFLFTSLGPAAPFADLVRELETRCGHLPLGEADFDPTRAREYVVNAHWALYVENYLEGFHIPYVHAGLAGALDYGEYSTELFHWSNLQLGIAAGDEDTFVIPAGHPDHGRNIAAWYWWLFPNTMLNVYPWGISVNVVRPLALDRTRVLFLPYVWDATKLDRGAGAGLDRVEREDEAIVESVQRGMRARLYARGRYSPTREQGVHHFQRMMVEALSNSK
ncbi:MAG: aromatic ring-hydroxylating dioxygenase subunit alpha [Candidatus Eisenbacteria bacterium]